MHWRLALHLLQYTLSVAMTWFGTTSADEEPAESCKEHVCQAGLSLKLLHTLPDQLCHVDIPSLELTLVICHRPSVSLNGQIAAQSGHTVRSAIQQTTQNLNLVATLACCSVYESSAEMAAGAPRVCMSASVADTTREQNMM